jgi:hypothetical protein
MITSRARVRMRWRVLAVAAVLLTLLTGCGVINRHACSLVGAIPGVSVEVPAALLPDAAAFYRLRVCADDSCMDWDTHGGEPAGTGVALPSGHWPGAVTARLTITHIDPATSVEQVVFDASTSVEVTLFEPNGPGCEPNVFAGSARATTEGHLEAINRHA